MADGENDSTPNLSISLSRQTLIRGKKRKITLHSMGIIYEFLKNMHQQCWLPLDGPCWSSGEVWVPIPVQLTVGVRVFIPTQRSSSSAIQLSMLRRRNSGQADPAEPPTVQTSTPVSSSVSYLQSVPVQTDITDMAARKRYELRRRRSLQQNEGDSSFTSSIAAAADEVIDFI
ncbi:unnamed protein product [Onchocerca ochengi]|uniref:Movement protein n=1 Tax=Onchocerca ochengi TaxID=42157 RepID=A0A182E733_ONCOC|nr:unnamed protein product [Onchocerca ochengi]